MTDSLLAEDTTTDIDPNKKYFEDLVGEGKKFKTPEDLARGKYEADAFIEILKKRQDELRSDYLRLREEAMAKAKLEELVNQLQSKQQTTPNSDTTAKSVEKPTYDPTELANLVSKQIKEFDLSKKQQENATLVRNKLTERFGSNYQASVKQQIANLGITEEQFNAMAQNTPQLLFKALDLDTKPMTEQFNAPPRSTQRGDNFSPSTQENKRTWSYYQEMKKNNPKLYYDPKIANQMMKDYERLGQAFEDGDFNAYG